MDETNININNQTVLPETLKTSLYQALPFKMNYCNAFKDEFNQPLDEPVIEVFQTKHLKELEALKIYIRESFINRKRKKDVAEKKQNDGAEDTESTKGNTGTADTTGTVGTTSQEVTKSSVREVNDIQVVDELETISGNSTSNVISVTSAISKTNEQKTTKSNLDINQTPNLITSETKSNSDTTTVTENDTSNPSNTTVTKKKLLRFPSDSAKNRMMNASSITNSAINTSDNNVETIESTDNPKQTYEEFIANKRLLANKKIVDTVEKEFSQIREISLNTPDSFSAFILDVDDIYDEHLLNKLFESGAVPEPSWITINPKSNRYHIVYLLEHLHLKKYKHNQTKYMTIYYYLSRVFRADRAYKGLWTHNPLWIGEYETCEEQKITIPSETDNTTIQSNENTTKNLTNSEVKLETTEPVETQNLKLVSKPFILKYCEHENVFDLDYLHRYAKDWFDSKNLKIPQHVKYMSDFDVLNMDSGSDKQDNNDRKVEHELSIIHENLGYGARNNTIFMRCMYFANQGYSKEKLQEQAKQDAEKYQQIKESSNKKPLSVRELDAIVNSVLKYHANGKNNVYKLYDLDGTLLTTKKHRVPFSEWQKQQNLKSQKVRKADRDRKVKQMAEMLEAKLDKQTICKKLNICNSTYYNYLKFVLQLVNYMTLSIKDLFKIRLKKKMDYYLSYFGEMFDTNDLLEIINKFEKQYITKLMLNKNVLQLFFNHHL
jgi:primase C terminal 1 (priCT-1)